MSRSLCLVCLGCKDAGELYNQYHMDIGQTRGPGDSHRGWYLYSDPKSEAELNEFLDNHRLCDEIICETVG